MRQLALIIVLLSPLLPPRSDTKCLAADSKVVPLIQQSSQPFGEMRNASVADHNLFTKWIHIQYEVQSFIPAVIFRQLDVSERSEVEQD